MRKIAANYVYPANSEPIKNGVIEVNEQGTIISLQPLEKEQANVEFYNGVLVPGFVNAHCHLELSHLRGKIEKLKSLPGFIQQVMDSRSLPQVNVPEFIEKSDKEMFRQGINVVGDISNTSNTITCKAKSNIKYHTFIEIPGTSNAEELVKKYLIIKDKFSAQGLKVSLSPHSLYSASSTLLEQINRENRHNLISIHNQEGIHEVEFLENGTGAMADLFKEFRVPFPDYVPAGKPVAKLLTRLLTSEIPVLLVHNTQVDEEDLHIYKSHFNRVTLVLCPASNLYIEGKMPPVSQFIASGIPMALGTDSLASNTELSILFEMQLIAQHFPATPFAELIRWATINGASALGVDEKYGSITPGKSPGINLIENFDFKNMNISLGSAVRRLI